MDKHTHAETRVTGMTATALSHKLPTLSSLSSCLYEHYRLVSTFIAKSLSRSDSPFACTHAGRATKQNSRRFSLADARSGERRHPSPSQLPTRSPGSNQRRAELGPGKERHCRVPSKISNSLTAVAPVVVAVVVVLGGCLYSTQVLLPEGLD